MQLTKLIFGVATAVTLVAGSALADWQPSGPITLDVGFNPGGSADATGRLLAQALEANEGWKIVVKNTGGGGGAVMAGGLMREEADGQTIGLAVSVAMAAALASSKNAPFELDSFDYLGTVAVAPAGFLAKPDAPFSSFRELVNHAKENGELVIGTPDRTSELIIRAIARDEGVGLVPLPTKGGADVIAGILGGTMDAGFSGGNHGQYLESKELKLIAPATRARQDFAPDMLTLTEQGFDYSIEPYFTILAPKGIPSEAHDAIAAAIDRATKSDDMISAVQNTFGVGPANLEPEGTAEMMTIAVTQAKKLAE